MSTFTARHTRAAPCMQGPASAAPPMLSRCRLDRLTSIELIRRSRLSRGRIGHGFGSANGSSSRSSRSQTKEQLKFGLCPSFSASQSSFVVSPIILTKRVLEREEWMFWVHLGLVDRS
ncbi:hypothetical protein BDV96DRAFT_597636 [Lophiotrema nucula]|uniref:Uncharacterized protein n=1 Tax=Lophiotrema nucula TaxID=690887 RepID=A0A6A5ZET9_9PLEO|nr:hypothetical protein BDV96DRAFT_597636 [Lophiotrema nucula]